MIMCWSTMPGLRNPSSDIQILVGRVQYAYNCCSHESFLLVSSSQHNLNSTRVQIPNQCLLLTPYDNFPLCFSVFQSRVLELRVERELVGDLISDAIHYRCIFQLELYLLLFYFHQGFQDHHWSIYLKYSSSDFNACLLDLSKVLSRGCFNLHPEVDSCVAPVV